VGIVSWVVAGLVVGALARLLLPGRDPVGCIGTILVGIVGSLLGGFVANLLFHDSTRITRAGLIGSILGAMAVLLVIRALRPRRY
jgi:uncharacterized membrane protein YeaQ/YmgE (transglycosylase-associated protein family)